MTVFESIYIMITFSMFVVAFITLIVVLFEFYHNKK